MYVDRSAGRSLAPDMADCADMLSHDTVSMPRARHVRGPERGPLAGARHGGLRRHAVARHCEYASCTSCTWTGARAARWRPTWRTAPTCCRTTL
ncbi:Inosine-5'-monophosphate dehydrogenase [Operophtera brumata]|uniref:Inosine-5'-monophosphate dehydrogenase n=1 Tax=Operophtera brumata TaxID=104452 RepID=A0A0L7LKN4_OPEBR|nr:Inosine-5'-monophosphate dehydrogenase [Operophtera brumata]